MTITAILLADQKTTIPGQLEAQLIMLNEEVCVIINDEKSFEDCTDESIPEILQKITPLKEYVKYVVLFDFEHSCPKGIYRNDSGVIMDITDTITDISTTFTS